MIDSTTYFLAYFYPRVAVYDDYNGWDRINFMDTHEFYSDFNDYTVNIKVPKNYIVWGTGTLQKPETVLQPAILQNDSNESMTTDQIIHIVTKEDLAAKNVTVQNELNTWQFKAHNIPDMAFGSVIIMYGMLPVWLWMTKRNGEPVCKPHIMIRRRIIIRWRDSCRHSLKWFSHKWPGHSLSV